MIDDPKTFRLLILCAVLIVLTVIGANVALVMTGHDNDSTLRLVSLLAAIAGFGGLNQAKLHRIEKQTNGELTRRIKDNGDDVVERVKAHVDSTQDGPA